MGRVLIGGTAALLICIFLSPKFIEFLRRREFGQQIREDGPEGHHQKAGTPTMGGVIIFIAIAVPFLILSNYEWRSVGVFAAALACALLGFADDYIKLVRSYAQSVANTQTCAEDAAAVILGVGLQLQKVGKRFKPSAMRLARRSNSFCMASSSWASSQSTAATSPMISSLATFMPRPTVLELGELFLTAASIRSFRPSSRPVHCGPRMPFPPENVTRSKPILV